MKNREANKNQEPRTKNQTRTKSQEPTLGFWKLVFVFCLVLDSWFLVLGAQPDAPYHLQVVLHVAENRFLTPLFKEQAQRDVRDQLQLAFGPLARVEVVTEHPLLAQVLDRGLQTALDGWDDLSGRSTHFVLIDFVQGRYELQARGHDGHTGLASPVTRQERTGDRRLVGQKAAELVAGNFSLAGTITPGGKDVELTIHGGKLVSNLGRWLQPGTLFTVTRIRQEGERVQSSPIPWAVLQVKDALREGRCVCQWFHRFAADGLSAEPGVSYRAVQLHTDRAPLQLQLIDADSYRPLDGVPLQIFRDGFAAKEKPIELTTNRDGLAVTRDPYTGIAFVRVLTRDTHQPRAQLPVEILEGRTVVVRLKLG